MELSLEQIFVLGLLASVLAQGVKLIAAKWGKDTGKIVASIVVIVASVALSYFWMRPEIPPATDPMQLAIALLQAALSVFGFAVLIYNFLLAKIFEVLNWTKYALLKY